MAGSGRPDAALIGALERARIHPLWDRYKRIGKGPDGRLVRKTIGTVLKDRGDAYVQDCKTK